MRALELWGGHECTLNRVGARYFDQTVRSGHHDRLDDLDRFAGLGVTALRYPVLWERIAPDHPDQRDWSWTDARLARMAELDLRPILGLLHHGSGPAYTGLLDEAFPRRFAVFARAAAERYPHVRDWTPVNEPLTTARFSCLYGLWHPHRADEPAFWTAFLNQIDGVRLAMAEIRAVNPDARLIQTEDLGRTYATPPLAYQADFDNHRRWMTWDLLFGRVTPDHALWDRLCALGLEARLAAIAERPCPPDILGVNHYVTSDRFLDHRCELYPPDRCGGNGETRYADLEATRVLLPAPGGLDGALEEAWRRYGATVAVTECHLGCTREEQLRWLGEAWAAVNALRERGADVAALTAWSLLGAFDWNSLLTRDIGHYEPGAFDVRGPEPRPTALAAALRNLAGAAGPEPAAQGSGWWRRDIRLTFRPVFHAIEHPDPRTAWTPPSAAGRPILIAGATGMLGKALARACEWRGLSYVLTDRARMPLDDADAIARTLDAVQPWAVINAAGFARVDEAERDRAAGMAANTLGAIRLGRAAHACGAAFASLSSDLVFDGRLDRPYVESDRTNPLNLYGLGKAQAEDVLLAIDGPVLMVRSAAFFSPYDPANFGARTLRALAAGAEVAAARDLIVSPTYVPDLVDALLDLVIDGQRGVWHLANDGAVSWADFARLIAEAFGYDPAQIRAVPWRDLGWPAERPAQVALASERGRILPPLENAIARYAAALRHADFPAEAEAEADRARADDERRKRAAANLA